MSYGDDPSGTDAPRKLMRPGRRDMLKWIGIGGTAALAGCSTASDTDQTTTTSGGGGGGGGGGSDDTTTTDDTTPTQDETADREVGGNYRSAVSNDAESLNWLTIADTTSGSYIDRVLDAAWTIAPGQEIFPLWAAPSTEDGKTYTITLRDNLQWGAGYGKMTAEDWVYMIENVFQADPNWSGYPSADDWFRGGEPIPVEQTGELTFEIQLPEIDPAFPYKPVMWGQYCMPKGLIEKYVPDQDGEGLSQDEEIQTIAYGGNLGPYVYERWNRESQYVTTRNENYYLAEIAANGGDDLWPDWAPISVWENAPYFDRTTIQVVQEQSARLGALESGEIDVAGLPPEQAQRFRDLDGVDVAVQPQPYVTPLVYNQRANGWEGFRIKEVRQALGYAVSKQTIADGVYRGFARPAQTMQPKWSKWYNDDLITNYGEGENYGSEICRQNMESALSGTEYEYDGVALVDGEGAQVELTLWYDQGQNTEQTLAEIIAQEFRRNAGISVEVRGTTSFIANFAANTPPEGEEVEWSAGYFNGGPRDVSVSNEAWDMSVNLGFNTYPYTPTSSSVFFGERDTINYYGYVPERDITGLYAEASRTADEEERKRILGEAFGAINEEQPFSFITMGDDIVGYQDRVNGYTEDFASGWDFPTWYFS